MTRHNKWISEGGVSPRDRAVYEHMVLSECLEMMCCQDQLQVCNLVGAELSVRRLQLIEEAHFVSPSAPSYDGAEHWMGTGRRRGGILVSPSLSKVVAEKVKDEYAVQKERRKGREERRQAPTKKDKTKGDPKGAGKAAAVP